MAAEKTWDFSHSLKILREILISQIEMGILPYVIEYITMIQWDLDFLKMHSVTMLILGSLVVLFAVSDAIDLTGCRPAKPNIINGLMQLMGDVTSPGYNEGQNYPDNVICEHRITAPYGFRIQLTISDIDIEPADMCTRDAVEIIELIGHPPQPQVSGVFCGNQSYQPIITQGNDVIILFRSDFMISHRGFKIKYLVTGMPRLCTIFEHQCRNRNCYADRDKCNGKDECGDGTDEENCGYPLPATECGLRITSESYSYDRIVGGKESEPGSWPWQADLQLSFIHPNGHMCGGTLINAQWVVSAAHCFEQFRDPRAWRIHLGNHHKFKKDASEQIRYVERIILFPGTTGDDLLKLPQIDITNDLSLLKLNAPVKFTDEVRPACLPTQGYELTVGKKCMASGWGMTRGTGSSHVLKEIDLSIEGADVCNGIMGPIQTDTMICVRNARGFQDVCHGDSGGPLVCEENNKWYVMGATSFGSQVNFVSGLCALPGSATIYSKVSHKINWINQQINKYS